MKLKYIFLSTIILLIGCQKASSYKKEMQDESLTFICEPNIKKKKKRRKILNKPTKHHIILNESIDSSNKIKKIKKKRNIIKNTDHKKQNTEDLINEKSKNEEENIEDILLKSVNNAKNIIVIDKQTFNNNIEEYEEKDVIVITNTKTLRLKPKKEIKSNIFCYLCKYFKSEK